MGVPKFFRFITRKYPNVIIKKPVEGYDSTESNIGKYNLPSVNIYKIINKKYVLEFKLSTLKGARIYPLILTID